MTRETYGPNFPRLEIPNSRGTNRLVEVPILIGISNASNKCPAWSLDCPVDDLYEDTSKCAAMPNPTSA
jgi:hypothetical protein